MRRRRKGVHWNFKEGSAEEFSNKESKYTRGPKPPRLQLSLMRTRLSQSGSPPSAHFLHLALRKAANEKPLARRRLLAPRCYLLSHKHARCTPAYCRHTMSDTLSGKHRRWYRGETASVVRLTVQR